MPAVFLLTLTLLAIEAHGSRDLVQINPVNFCHKMDLKPQASGFFCSHKHAKFCSNFCSKEAENENYDFELKTSNIPTQNNTQNELIFNLKLGSGHQVAYYHVQSALVFYDGVVEVR